MELKQVIKQIHSLMEVKNKGNKINHEEMSKKIGVSKRAYSEYYRGKNQPLAMKALLKMLNNLNNDEIVRVVRMAKDVEVKSRSKNNNDEKFIIK